MCIFSHCVYKKSGKIINFLKTQKKTIKPNPYPRKGQTGIGFFLGYTPPRFKLGDTLLIYTDCEKYYRF